MRILFTLLNYGQLTGSELYVYELARELSKENDVFIQSNITKGILYQKTLELGVPMLGFSNKKPEIDVIHASQIQPTQFALQNYSVPVIQTIHSEILPEYENPVEGCAAYISIRKEIKDSISIESELVYNPFDTTRFTPFETNNLIPTVLFVGGIDYLRQNVIVDLLKQAKRNEIHLVGIGKGWSNLNDDNVMGLEPLFNVEEWTKRCDKTAGIKLGRTSIEGWLCGKPAIIYDVDTQGNICGKHVKNPPKDLNKFDSRVVAEKTLGIYKKCL